MEHWLQGNIKRLLGFCSKTFYNFASHSELTEPLETIWFVPKLPLLSLCLHLLFSSLSTLGSLNSPTILLLQDLVSYCCFTCKHLPPDFEMPCILTFFRLCSNAALPERTSLITLCKLVFNLLRFLPCSYQYPVYNTFTCLISALLHYSVNSMNRDFGFLLLFSWNLEQCLTCSSHSLIFC